MDIQTLQRIVINALEDVKAQDIQLFDTTNLTSMFDRIAIASGTSGRQTRALASSVRDQVKEAGGKVVSIEGENTGEWVLVDLGDMVVHIMQPTIRAYYRLEEIWGEKAISLTAAKRLPKKAADDKPKAKPAAKKAAKETAAAEETPKKRTTRKTAAAKEVPVTEEAPKKRTTKKAAEATAEAAPKKRVVKKAADTAETAPAKAPAKKTVAKKKTGEETAAPATQKAAAKKAPAKASPAQKATAKSKAK
ncbi:MAG: hypothetical protein H6R01_1018 [Burkholderiaceae bacterium]|nr:hypothetical protein [Burkholderiaceae bacterium]